MFSQPKLCQKVKKKSRISLYFVLIMWIFKKLSIIIVFLKIWFVWLLPGLKIKNQASI